MTDEAALLAAVAAAPDDDLPRLVFADWLDENGRPDRAEFIRAQVRLAAAEPWDPFAVLCQHRRPDWLRGDPWWETLPQLNPRGIEWHPDYAFRRGFGWAVIVRDVGYLLEVGSWLFDAAPVGELHLPASWPLDVWRRFAAAPWLPRVRSVHFYGTRTPIEPIRVLCASSLATGLEAIAFERADSTAMPLLVNDLLTSPLRRRLRRLAFRGSPTPVEEFVAALCDPPGPRLEHLTLANVGMDTVTLSRLMESALVDGLLGLTMSAARGSSDSPLAREVAARPRRLADLRLNRAGPGARALEQFTDAPGLAHLQRIDLSDNPLWNEYNLTDPVGRADVLAGLRAASLRRCTVGDATVEVLVQSRFWPHLTELDLRDNRITDAGAVHLLTVPVPAEMTALLLGGNPVSEQMWDRLRDRFGDALIAPETLEVTGL